MKALYPGNLSGVHVLKLKGDKNISLLWPKINVPEISMYHKGQNPHYLSGVQVLTLKGGTHISLLIKQWTKLKVPEISVWHASKPKSKPLTSSKYATEIRILFFFAVQ